MEIQRRVDELSAFVVWLFHRYTLPLWGKGPAACFLSNLSFIDLQNYPGQGAVVAAAEFAGRWPQ